MPVWVKITNDGTDALNFPYAPFVITRAPTELVDEAAADQVIAEALELGVTIERTGAP